MARLNYSVSKLALTVMLTSSLWGTIITEARAQDSLNLNAIEFQAANTNHPVTSNSNDDSNTNPDTSSAVTSSIKHQENTPDPAAITSNSTASGGANNTTAPDAPQAERNNPNAVFYGEEQVPKGSLIKEKGRVYRDAFGNRIVKPAVNEEGAQVSNIPGKSIIGGSSPENLSAPAAKAQVTQNPADAKHSDNGKYIIDRSLTLDNARIAVIYFSQTEDINSNDVDELTGASIIYDATQKRKGTMEYVAGLIAKETGADIYRIEKLRPYPTDHDDLIYQASLELDNKMHPAVLLQPTLDLNNYDVIFLGYPIWWYNLPMPLYSFFDRFDLSGKIVLPFCSHGGSRPYKTFAIIAQQEPNAHVAYNKGLILDRLDIPPHGADAVKKWIEALRTNLTNRPRPQPQDQGKASGTPVPAANTPIEPAIPAVSQAAPAPAP